MAVSITQLLSQTTKQPPCPADEFSDFVSMVGPAPHQDYLDFMACHNGCAGPVGNEGYVSIWSLDEVISGTEQAETAEFAPGLLLFGGDGGNEVLAFDREDPKWPIVMVPLVGMSRNEMKRVASTFTDFIHLLASDVIWS